VGKGSLVSESDYRSVFDWIRAYRQGAHAGSAHIQEWFDGRYQLEEFLGEGQTSIVFRATDTRLDRISALKIWAPSDPDPDLDPAMLLREAKYLAKVEHSQIVRVLDYGIETTSNRPWMSLEYLGRRTLRTLIQETGGLSANWPAALQIAIQICALVEYLHSSIGIFQLDLKPDNFSIDLQNKLRLMDLGSAMDPRNRSQRIGTPGYVAPEILLNTGVDYRCDIFSAGVLLYELVVGKSPLRQDRLRREGSLDFATRAFSSTVISREVRTVDDPDFDFLKFEAAGIPDQFAELIARMCSKRPEDRPSAAECEAALLKLVEPSKETVRPSVFICHSHLDKERFVREFGRLLDRRGLKVWLDEWSLKTGEPFWERIGTAIQSSDFIIVVLSQNSLRSQGVLEELRTAQIFDLDRVKVLPIRIDPIVYSEIPVHLRTRHVLDFVGWEDRKILKARTAKLASDILSLSDQ
jgi:serine/threonine protein kinase